MAERSRGLEQGGRKSRICAFHGQSIYLYICIYLYLYLYLYARTPKLACWAALSCVDGGGGREHGGFLMSKLGALHG